MHNDDRPVGRLLSRREVGGLFAASFAAAAAAARLSGEAAGSASSLSAPDCVALPQQTEGPYFVDRQMQRTDIRLDPSTGRTSEGTPLDLRLVVSAITAAAGCGPLKGATVDIWHCDAIGRYSDVRDRRTDTTGQKFLRGYQMSDAGGAVRFTTIYPGWYPGRAVHIHFKIRVPAANGRMDEFTSQLYFDEALTERVHAAAPYTSNRGQRTVNERDMVFRDGGTQLLLPVSRRDGRLSSTFTIAMQRR